jgi:hypothetical protein
MRSNQINVGQDLPHNPSGILLFSSIASYISSFPDMPKPHSQGSCLQIRSSSQEIKEPLSMGSKKIPVQAEVN